MKTKPERKAVHYRGGSLVHFYENQVLVGTQDVSGKSLHWIENVIENWENFVLNEIVKAPGARSSGEFLSE